MADTHITIVMVWGIGICIGVVFGIALAAYRYRRATKLDKKNNEDTLEFRTDEND
jgi:hypothetical protein